MPPVTREMGSRSRLVAAAVEATMAVVVGVVAAVVVVVAAVAAVVVAARRPMIVSCLAPRTDLSLMVSEMLASAPEWTSLEFLMGKK